MSQTCQTVQSHPMSTTTLERPLWIITSKPASCDACGWLTGAVPHYEHCGTWAESHHCTTCHPIGRDWIKKGDSEKPTTDWYAAVVTRPNAGNLWNAVRWARDIRIEAQTTPTHSREMAERLASSLNARDSKAAA